MEFFDILEVIELLNLIFYEKSYSLGFNDLDFPSSSSTKIEARIDALELCFKGTVFPYVDFKDKLFSIHQKNC